MSRAKKERTVNQPNRAHRLIGAVSFAVVVWSCTTPQPQGPAVYSVENYPRTETGPTPRTETGPTPPMPDPVLAAPLPPICSNQELLKAINIIDRACQFDRGCDFGALKEMDQSVDKPTLMQALRNNWLSPVHLFFPEGKYRIADALDWRSTKEDQLRTLKGIDDPAHSVIYVLGRASATGDMGANRRLSQQRANAVIEYLRDKLKVPCGGFHAAWFGREALQLGSSDAHLLNIDPQDYREDLLILNQSVHVFVFPCHAHQ